MIRTILIAFLISGCMASNPTSPTPNSPEETSRHGSYLIEDCIGAAVNGVCQGRPSPGDEIRNRTGQDPRCHGRVLNGRCIGPEF
jgi:hypothetical protein